MSEENNNKLEEQDLENPTSEKEEQVSEELKDQEGQYDKTIDLGNKANGIYMLNITTNNKNINHKIVIQ